MTVRVKICGLTRERDVLAALDAGVDAIGFIVGFPSSPRNNSISRARELARMVPPFVDTVLVVPDRTLVNHIREFRNLSPDLIQIYGTSISPGTVRESLHARVIKPLLVGKNTRVGTEAVDGYDAVLSDTYKMGSGGGTGEVSNWEICRRIRRQLAPLPFILSGGLRPENIILAIKKVKPFAVDVSSGVEISPGIKDRKKMTEFVARAKMDGKAQEL